MVVYNLPHCGTVAKFYSSVKLGRIVQKRAFSNAGFCVGKLLTKHHVSHMLPEKPLLPNVLCGLYQTSMILVLYLVWQEMKHLCTFHLLLGKHVRRGRVMLLINVAKIDQVFCYHVTTSVPESETYPVIFKSVSLIAALQHVQPNCSTFWSMLHTSNILRKYLICMACHAKNIKKST